MSLPTLLKGHSYSLITKNVKIAKFWPTKTIHKSWFLIYFFLFPVLLTICTRVCCDIRLSFLLTPPKKVNFVFTEFIHIAKKNFTLQVYDLVLNIFKFI